MYETYLLTYFLGDKKSVWPIKKSQTIILSISPPKLLRETWPNPEKKKTEKNMPAAESSCYGTIHWYIIQSFVYWTVRQRV